jgi:hypothetical protein
MAKINIARMEDNAPCRKITFSQPEGSRKKGRPKLRWLDSVLKDHKTLKVTEWWRTAQNRDRWNKMRNDWMFKPFLYFLFPTSFLLGVN